MQIRIQNIIDSMTLEEKVGQLFVARRPQDPRLAVEAVTRFHLGGFTLYACDFENTNPAELKNILEGYQAGSKVPMFIAADEEGGRVIRASKFPAFRESGFKSPRDLMAEGGLSRVDADTREKAAFLLDLGINFNYAPVLDMSGNPECFIFDRTVSNDADITAQ